MFNTEYMDSKGRVIVAGLLLIWASLPANAQQREAVDSAERSRCAVLVSRTANARDVQDYFALNHCGQQGLDVLLAAWVSPPTDSSAVRGLVYASFGANNQKILDRALAVAKTSKYPDLIRLAALEVLASYATSHMVLVAAKNDTTPVTRIVGTNPETVKALMASDVAFRRSWVSITIADHGRAPLVPAPRALIIREIEGIYQREPETRVGKVAEILAVRVKQFSISGQD